jgi:hypothetical protein
MSCHVRAEMPQEVDAAFASALHEGTSKISQDGFRTERRTLCNCEAL